MQDVCCLFTNPYISPALCSLHHTQSRSDHWEVEVCGAKTVHIPEMRPIAVAELSKAWVCSRSPAGIAGSNPSGGMDVCLLWVLCVLSGRDLCDGLITRPEESYRLWCVLVCDFVTSSMRRLKLIKGCKCRIEEEIPEMRIFSCGIWYSTYGVSEV
jgi:hypothetical protein